ncbi:MAG TPA: hypothetical protein VKP14_10920 [Gaiellaceae bacterium]|nr:hypothetical protein [Gaiellaceae bacterium]
MRVRLQASRLGATIFTVSTLVVSPLIAGGTDNGPETPRQPVGHASHHQK